jgi:hypothetical protein
LRPDCLAKAAKQGVSPLATSQAGFPVRYPSSSVSCGFAATDFALTERLDSMVGHAGMAATSRQRPPSQPSAVSNGSKLFASNVADRLDARWLRRARDLISDFSVHVGGAPTVAQQTVIRRISTIIIDLELIEQRMAKGGGASSIEDFDRYHRGCGTLKRFLEMIGMQHVGLRDVTPDDFDIEKEEGAVLSEASE